MYSNPEAILWEEMVLPLQWQEPDKDLNDEAVKLIPLLSILPVAIDEAGGPCGRSSWNAFHTTRGFLRLFLQQRVS